ncbi:hypothetical protein JCM10020v2_001554 [Rhodotorula toruloides]
MPASTTLASTALALLVAARAVLAATSIQSPALYQCTPAAFQYECDAPPCTVVARPSNDPTSMIGEIGTVNDASGSISWRPTVAAGQQVTVYITDNNGAVGNNSPTTVAAGTSDSCLSGGAASSGAGAASSASSGATSAASSAHSSASGAAASVSSSLASATSSLSSRVDSAVASASSAAASASSQAVSTGAALSSSASSAAASASASADKGSGAASIAINGSRRRSSLVDALPDAKKHNCPAEPQTQEEPEEEWLLKSILWPPLPPPPSAAGQDGREVVREEFETDDNLRVKVICQNANGPCSLIALCNILILRNDLHIAGRTSVTYSHLSNLLADYFLRVTSSPSSNPSSPSTELSLTAALSILPQTRYGLNLNPRFDRIDGFSTSTSSSASGKGELALFALADIPLLHGWLADPSDPETYDVLVGSEGCRDYDTAMEWVVEGSEVAGGAEKLQLREEEMSEEEMVKEVERRSGWSEEQEKKVRRAHLINTFLFATSTQLSYPGLSALCQSPSLLPPSGLAALFRNSHLSVLYRRPSVPSTPSSPTFEGPELFTLVTDAAFASEEGIVWESLGDTNGEASEFYDAALRRSSVRGGDWVGGGARGQRREREPVVQHEGVENPADIALAQQLQAEEDAYERHLVEQQRHEDRHRQQQEPAAPPPRRDERVEAQGRTSGAGAGAAKASKRLSKMAGGGGKGEKEKCVVM